jgi:hypothetical protein
MFLNLKKINSRLWVPYILSYIHNLTFSPMHYYYYYYYSSSSSSSSSSCCFCCCRVLCANLAQGLFFAVFLDFFRELAGFLGQRAAHHKVSSWNESERTRSYYVHSQWFSNPRPQFLSGTTQLTYKLPHTKTITLFECVHASARTHTHTHTHTHIHVYTHVYTHIYEYILTYMDLKYKEHGFDNCILQYKFLCFLWLKLINIKHF